MSERKRKNNELSPNLTRIYEFLCEMCLLASNRTTVLLRLLLLLLLFLSYPSMHKDTYECWIYSGICFMSTRNFVIPSLIHNAEANITPISRSTVHPSRGNANKQFTMAYHFISVVHANEGQRWDKYVWEKTLTHMEIERKERHSRELPMP